MKRRIAVATAAAGVLAAVVTPIVAVAGTAGSSAQSACVHLTVTINGTTHHLNRCVP
jgi:uncharacterized protein YabE (DUF348 family)